MENEPSRRPWDIDHGSATKRYSSFISHVSGDVQSARRLAAEISALSVRDGLPALTCFLDVHNWRPGVEPRKNIQEALLASEHVVVWATPKYLAELGRGWVWYELAYADLIDQTMQYDLSEKTPLRAYPFVIPILRGVVIEDVARTPLCDYWQRSIHRPDRRPAISEVARLLIETYRDNHPVAPRRVDGPGGGR